MGSELMLDENWRETWSWFLASTPGWTPKLIAFVGVALAAFGLWKIATGNMTGGGKRVGIGATLLFMVITLAPGPVVSIILRFIELVIGLVVSFVNHVSG